jgi:hypothetical protein
MNKTIKKDKFMITMRNCLVNTTTCVSKEVWSVGKSTATGVLIGSAVCSAVALGFLLSVTKPESYDLQYAKNITYAVSTSYAPLFGAIVGGFTKGFSQIVNDISIEWLKRYGKPSSLTTVKID